MSEIVAFINENYRPIGNSLAVITAAVCAICSIVFTIRNPESDYMLDIEFEAIPRLILMLVLSVVAGGMMFFAWVVFAPLALIGLAMWLVIQYKDWRIIRNARRRMNA
jgi:hypothetical protein